MNVDHLFMLDEFRRENERRAKQRVWPRNPRRPGRWPARRTK